MKDASSWELKVISHSKFLHLSLLTAHPLSNSFYRNLYPSEMDCLKGNYCQVDPIAPLCHSNTWNLVFIRWLSNGIRAFIYFVRHHQTPLSLSQTTCLIPQLWVHSPAQGWQTTMRLKEKLFFLEATELRKLNGDKSKWRVPSQSWEYTKKVGSILEQLKWKCMNSLIALPVTVGGVRSRQ